MNQHFHADLLSAHNTCIVTVGSTTPTTRSLFVQERLFGNTIGIDGMFKPNNQKQTNYNPNSSSIQFIIKLPQQISYSTVVEVLGQQPIRKGKLLIWPKASLEQQIKMAVIDMIHDRVSYLKNVTVSYSDDNQQKTQITF